jgi:phosphate:Na+ symporter
MTFNVVTGLVALLILPLLFWVVNTTGKLLGLEDIPAVTLALFHTTFNIFGVLLMWLVSRHLTQFLEKRFVTLEEVEGRPRFLDKTVAVSPTLALNALILELTRIATVARRMALAALSTESGPGKRIASDHLVAEKLAHAVDEFINQLGKESLSVEVAGQLAKILQAEQHLLACVNQALWVSRAQAELEPVADVELAERIARFRMEVAGLMELSDPEAKGFSLAACEEQLERMQVSYNDVKAVLAHAGVELRTPVPGVIDHLDQMSRIRRMARQMIKAMRYLSELYVVADIQIPETIEAADQKANT